MVSPNLLYPELERIPFVGREESLREIASIMDNAAGKPTIIFITGRGGIGKTELIKKVIKNYSEAKRRWSVATEVVDVYHAEIRTKTGLADRIVDVVPGRASTAFREYRNARNKYGRQLLSESGKGVRTELAAMRQMFEQGLGKLSQKKAILIAIDTAEKLVYHQVQPTAGYQVDDVWPWLCELLRYMRNIVVLVAGRPQIEALVALATKYDELNCQHVVLPQFDYAESGQYLTALQNRLINLGKKAEAGRLKSLDPLIRENAHRLTGGDPISLALFADLVAVGGPLPAELYGPPTPAPTETALELDHTQLQNWLVGKLIERPALGLTLRALGFLPQGATHELLAKAVDAIESRSVLAESVDERLSAIAYLAIVKIRRGDQRVFLHDEVYAILHRMENAPSGAETSRKVNHAIQSFYDQHSKDAAGHFNATSAELETKRKPTQSDFNKAVTANNNRRRLLIEALYYRIRQDDAVGFERYFRYISEAILTGDIVQARELQMTLLEFLAEHPNSDIDQLARETLAVLPMQLQWAEGNHEGVVVLAKQKRGSRRNVLYVSDATVDTWEAYARIYLGGEPKLDAAKALLDRSIDYLDRIAPKEIPNPEQLKLETWYALAVLAIALRIRGYWMRSAGRLRASLPDYRRAVKILRRLNLEVELATALNDLGYTSAELGLVDEGRALVIEARDLRESLGSRHGVAYSLNTLAMIDVIQGHFDAAIPSAERALAIFRMLGNDRGEGLCELTLAEAWRRKSIPESIPDDENALQNLEEALRHAKQALKKARITGEPLRQAQAWVEIGCAFRDMVRTGNDNTTEYQSVSDAAPESEAALREAANVAGAVSIRWQIDAWVNLSWLGKYSDNQKLLELGNKEARATMKANGLEDYYVNEESGKPIIETEQGESWVWAQIGKLHVVLADHAFDRYISSAPKGLDRNPENKDLEEAIRHYAIGLENNQYGGEAGSRDLRRVKQQVHAKIKKLSNRELLVVSNQLGTFEAQFHLDKAYMRQFLEECALL